jgi:hypothetical protein
MASGASRPERLEGLARQAALGCRRDSQGANYTDIRDAVLACVAAARRCGMETLVLSALRRAARFGVAPDASDGNQMNNFHIVI